MWKKARLLSYFIELCVIKEKLGSAFKLVWGCLKTIPLFSPSSK